MPEFSLDVNDLDEQGKDYAFPVRASWLALELEGCPGVRPPAPHTADGQLSIHAQRSGGEYLVRGRVTATVVADCYRCLEDVVCPVASELTALYAPAPAAKPGSTSKSAAKPAAAPRASDAGRAPSGRHAAPADDDAEDLAADDLDREIFSGDTLVLDGLVREHVILEVPMQPLCREDCPGIPIPEHIRGPANFGEEETGGGAFRAALSRLETKK